MLMERGQIGYCRIVLPLMEKANLCLPNPRLGIGNDAHAPGTGRVTGIGNNQFRLCHLESAEFEFLQCPHYLDLALANFIVASLGSTGTAVSGVSGRNIHGMSNIRRLALDCSQQLGK